MAGPEHFTAREAARYSKLTLSMVNYLCRVKVLEPSGALPRGRGRSRAYTFGDVVVLRALKRLLESGISVAKLNRALDDLRDHHPEITRTSLPGRFLVTDGVTVFFREKKSALESLDGKGQFAFAFVVEMKRVRGEVIQAIEVGATG